jgi:hypothetical protein
VFAGDLRTARFRAQSLAPETRRYAPKEIMCKHCESEKREIWTQKDCPELTEIVVGNWITLTQCKYCEQFWTCIVLEPYGSYQYWVKWNKSDSEWSSFHDLDDGKRINELTLAKIRELYSVSSADIREAIEHHEKRSYGHYNLTGFSEKKHKNWFSLRNWFGLK